MEKSDLEKLSLEELIDLAETNTSNFRWSRSSIYKAIFEKYKKMDEKNELEDIKKEIMIFDLSMSNSTKNRFDSMIYFNVGNGEEIKYPDLERNFPKEAIEYYRKRANTTNNPILKARYSDFIWEHDKDINHAYLTIKAYLDCCQIYFNNGWDDELTDSLDRAITIALMISNQNLIDESLKRHFEFISKLVEEKRFRYLIEIIESILKREDKIKNQINYEYLISIMESAILDYDQNVPDSFHLQRSFIELLLIIWRIRKNESALQNTKSRIAESFIEEAEWKKSNNQTSNTVIAHLLEKALQIYMDLGNFPEKVNELKIKILEANEAASKTEYKTISAKTEIPREKIEEYLGAYKERKTTEIFQIMSLDKNLVPSYQKARENAIEQTKKSVFQYIFPETIMRGNICVKRISEPDEKLEFNTIINFQMHYKIIEHVLLNEIFDLLEKEHPNHIEALIEYLSSSEIIENERIKMIKHGLQAFKDKEYIASIHILIFQIEGILRDLLRKLGLPTFAFRKNEMRERLLSDILTALSQIEGTDKDFLKFIEIFLCDIRGDNYRNDIAHGLLTVEAFTRKKAQLLLFILIKLSSYYVIKKKTEEV